MNGRLILLSVETNYQNVYYFSDATLGITILVVMLFLDIKVEKNKESFVHSFKNIFNPASAIFLLLVFGLGIPFGVGGSYGIIYLQEDLQASSTMIGKYSVDLGDIVALSTFPKGNLWTNNSYAGISICF